MEKFRINISQPNGQQEFEATRTSDVDMSRISDVVYTITNKQAPDSTSFKIKRVKDEWVEVEPENGADYQDESLVEAIGEELEFEDSDVLGIDPDDVDTGLDDENSDGFDWTLGDR
jgi:hypothetical protein